MDAVHPYFSEPRAHAHRPTTLTLRFNPDDALAEKNVSVLFAPLGLPFTVYISAVWCAGQKPTAETHLLRRVVRIQGNTLVSDGKVVPIKEVFGEGFINTSSVDLETQPAESHTGAAHVFGRGAGAGLSSVGDRRADRDHQLYASGTVDLTRRSEGQRSSSGASLAAVVTVTDSGQDDDTALDYYRVKNTSGLQISATATSGAVCNCPAEFINSRGLLCSAGAGAARARTFSYRYRC
jgi:hypothetical protein